MKKTNIITAVSAHEMLDSRGNPTLRVTVEIGSAQGTFEVPSGASTGSHEAAEKRDGDIDRFRGLGVKKTIASVNTHIQKLLVGKDARDQKEIDRMLIAQDGTNDKSRFGANGILGASMACAAAAAASERMPLWKYLSEMAGTKPRIPYLYLNLINAGKHASSWLAFQEYMIVPLTDDVESALVIADRVRSELRKEILRRYSPFSANYGDEGGFVIEAKKVAEPLEMLSGIIRKLKLEDAVMLAIDAAASSFYEKGKYLVDGKKLSADALLLMYRDIIKKFPIISIEDPFHEEDFGSFARILASQNSAKIIGDDLTVTNPDRLAKAIGAKSINGIIIKPNQIGTLSETLDVMRLAESNKISCIVSHRSGETDDSFIADLAYAFGSFGLKAGAPNRGERVAKYNRLWEISRK